MKIVFLGSCVIALLTLYACGSDNGPDTEQLPVAEAGAKDAREGSTDVDSGNADSGAPGDAGSDCGKTATLHPPKGDGGVYCPFSGVDGGPNAYCGAGTVCCEAPAGASTASSCVAAGTSCPAPGSTVWECGDPADCQAGAWCCAYGTDAGLVTVKQDVCGPFLSHFGGTRCAPSCAGGELIVCEEQATCTGASCVAVKPKGAEIGICQ